MSHTCDSMLVLSVNYSSYPELMFSTMNYLGRWMLFSVQIELVECTINSQLQIYI